MTNKLIKQSEKSHKEVFINDKLHHTNGQIHDCQCDVPPVKINGKHI